MEDIDSLEETEEKVAIQKPKRQLTDKQKEATALNLAKGRAVRDAKRQVKKEENLVKKNQHKARIEEIVANKAVKMAKKEDKLKQLIGEGLSEEDDNDFDIEERVFKRPKRKKVIYREESDSEEEMMFIKKRRSEVPVPTPAPVPPPAPISLPKRVPIMFY